MFITKNSMFPYLIELTIDIAKACEYLEERKMVHRLNILF